MKEKLKVLKILHIALCVGMVLAYVVIGDLKSLAFLELPELNTEAIVYICIPIAAIFVGNFLFRSQVDKIDRKKNLEDKIPFYQSAALLRWAILEGAAFIILFIKPDLIILGIFIIAYMIFLHPTEAKIKQDLRHTGR
ncbi:MFS transporter [Maribacter sp. TH_r10]|uniref:MFS transporter n=1 Tax=Maribacter sp. TH_r10 TaxID=3082086 RepID=UPI002953A6DC|nr:MFS transporter [Maribacter sp. TH_r10]MDV7137710.1 MFS transporter [Maribacter sp. TH_r10]